VRDADSTGGTNPALRTFYYRLLRLIALSIHPVFVFDGPNKPPFKRNKRTGPNVASIPEFLAKQLLKQFGYPIHLAPGEAEAECALLQREGIVDAVLSEDVDTLMFGSGITIRNWSPEKSGKTPTHVNVYDAVETKNGPSGLDREGMILVALMSGGDYVPEGIPGCGPKTACEAAKAGFGHDLCRIPTSDKRAMSEWRERLQHELKTNESKLFRRKHGTLKIPDDFPRLDILGYYTHPAISNQAGLDKLRRTINWDQDLDFPGLRDFTHDAFDWVKLEGAKHFIRSLAPSLLVRQLRIRSKELARLPTENLRAIQEDEALLVKGIHGKRQHPVTDNCTELRVSFTPIELVTIDLSREEPDDEPDVPPPGSQTGEVDLDDEVAEELEDDGPKKRGPTKFEPSKPARIWVMESIVKVGVPLTVEDWEAERQTKQKPRRPATAQDTTSSVPKASKARRTKTANDIPQAPINQFAKVTKPGSKLSRTLAKALDAPSSSRQPTPQSEDIIDLLSSPPVAQRSAAPVPRPVSRKSPSPVLPELPASVTKRKKRLPMQRSQTLPAQLGEISERPKTPPLSKTVESMDLLSSPIIPSPSQLPAKKAKTRIMTTDVARAPRGISVASSPEKTKQTTLDTWRASATPTKLREIAPALDTTPIPTPLDLRPSRNEVDELDLTLSSPTRSAASKPIPATARRTAASSTTRPPLTLISSNSSSLSSCSIPNSGKSSKDPAPATRNRRTSPHLRKTKSATPAVDSVDLLSSQPNVGRKVSPEVESVDLSCLSSPAPPVVRKTSPAVDAIDLSCLSSPAPPTINIRPEPAQTVPISPPSARSPATRRSPRNHTSLSPEPLSKTSPPAAWKARERKKRQIILRKSVLGAWDLVDVDSPQKLGDGGGGAEVLKGKDRRKWRESEVEFLDLS
jgi:Holliday junction resolvase YEN1